MLRKLLALVFFFLVIPAFVGAGEALATAKWGTIMYVHAKTNLRAKRTIESSLRGQLQAGQAVKADFLQDDWYAVFKPAETRRNLRYALGYVYAPRLFPTREGEEARAETTAKKEKPSFTIKPGSDAVNVQVKSIRFRVTEDGKEAVLVEFDRFYMPAVYYIEGQSPRIILDVTNTTSMRPEWADMLARGTMIKHIRATSLPAGNILRIALDMDPAKNYNANPVLYRGENTYAVEVAEIPPAKPAEPPKAAESKPAPAAEDKPPVAVPAEPKK
jgi:hypothetical protein